MLAKILKVFPLEQREFTAKDGSNQVFQSKKVALLFDGGSVVGELLQEKAAFYEKHPLYEHSQVFVNLQFQYKEIPSKNGGMFVSNEVIIQKIVEL